MSAVIDEKMTVGPCEIHYIESGVGGGQDILLLHGMKFNARTWQDLGTLAV